MEQPASIEVAPFVGSILEEEHNNLSRLSNENINEPLHIEGVRIEINNDMEAVVVNNDRRV